MPACKERIAKVCRFVQRCHTLLDIPDEYAPAVRVEKSRAPGAAAGEELKAVYLTWLDRAFKVKFDFHFQKHEQWIRIVA